MKNNIKIASINKGNSDLINKVDQINHLLTKHKPDLLVINELNLNKNDTTTKNQFIGYNLEHDQQLKTNGTARTGILIKSNINYKRRKDLESDKISTVWVQVKTKENFFFLVQAVYRQFKLIGVDGTRNITQQNERWKILVDKWLEAQEEQREIVTIGDINLNSLKWDTDYGQKSTYEKSRHKMYQILKNNILDQGTFQVNKIRTRESEIGTNQPACSRYVFHQPAKQNNKP